MLLVRVRGNSGESFRGWMARLADKNGYPNGDWMCRHLLKRRLDGVSLYLAHGLVNGDAEHLQRLEGVVPEVNSHRHKLRISGVTFPASMMRLPLRQVCPVCLDTNGWARGAWEALTAGYCREHDIALVSFCPSCHRNLNWTSMGLFQCSCGFDLRSLPAVRTSAEMREADALLAGDGMRVQGRLSADWSALPIEERVDLIWMLGAITRGETDSKIRLLDHARAAQLMEAAGLALLDWPGRVIAGLGMLDGKTASLRWSLGSSYKWLMADRSTPALEPLREVVIEYVLDHRSAPVHHRARRALGLSCSHPGAETAGQASRRMGISRGSISSLVTSGRLQGFTAGAGRRRLTKIESSEVDRYLQKRQAAYRREEVMVMLGITKRRFKELCDESLLPVLEGGKVTSQSIWRLDREGVDAICEVLQELGPKLSKVPTEGIVFGDAMRTRLELGELAVSLGAILRKELPVMGRIDAPSVVGALVVERAELVMLLQRHREAASKTISIVETASRLAIKQEVAYHLVARELLPSVEGHRDRRMNRRIALSSLEDFSGSYVWLRDLARRCGTSPRRIKGLLEARGVAPITAPEIDGCRQILYVRADVEGWVADQPWSACSPCTKLMEKS